MITESISELLMFSQAREEAGDNIAREYNSGYIDGLKMAMAMMADAEAEKESQN